MNAKGYFVIIPDHVVNMVGEELSKGAFFLYVYLSQMTRFQNDPTIQIGHAALAEKMGVSVRSVNTYRAELESLGLIIKRSQKDPDNPAYNLENLYTVVVKNISGGHEENFMRGHEENCIPPYIDPLKKKTSKKSANASASYEASFEKLWSSYPAPTKGSKKTANSRYKTLLKKYPATQIQDFMNHYLRTREITEQSGVFVANFPYLSTWLSQERWEDFKALSDNRELTASEVNKILGPDNWAPPMPPAELGSDAEAIRAWREQLIEERLNERRKKAMGVINGR